MCPSRDMPSRGPARFKPDTRQRPALGTRSNAIAHGLQRTPVARASMLDSTLLSVFAVVDV
ncbi:MAG: hypothetical protein ACRETT_00460 [Steroidobacteraceae bacterium]